MDTGNEFLISAVKRLKYYKDLGDKSFAQLNDTDFQVQPDEESNSIAIIIQHMAGNMLSRWTDFLSSDDEKEWRNRDSEFEPANLNRQDLIAYWEKGWQCCINAIESLQPADLLKTIYIRHEGLLVVDAINRQLAHYPYHVGQIVYLARMLRGQDWKNLSIPKGNSDAFNLQMKSKS